MRFYTLLLTLLISSTCAFAQTSKSHLYFEKDYQKVWRVDCVTNTHAIEFDFAPKWAESIGQALYYGEVLKKKPGIVLIVENPEKSEKYINRVKTIAVKSGITLWIMYPEDMKK